MFKEFKKLWKVFLFLFLISFLIVNWNEVSWVFNYRIVSDFLGGVFQKEETRVQTEELLFSSEKEGEPETNFYEKESSLEISKINISVPLVFPESSEINEVSKALDRGAVLFPDSVLPGEKGQTVILGHSAPLGWPKIKHDWVFSRLNELVEGDEVIVFFNNRKYQYSVTKKIFLEKGEEISESDLTKNENVLILISCWPPGKDIRRIAVEAKLN